jgi:hypothetical protein
MRIRTAVNPKNQGSTYYVTGDHETEYIVHHKRNAVSHRRAWTCNCPDFTERRQFRNDICKHIQFVATMMIIPSTQLAPAPIPVSVSVSAPASVLSVSATAKSVLESVVSVLNSDTDDAGILWDILTALRGPDNSDDKVKNKTTARIRHVIGLKSSTRSGAITNTEKPVGANQITYFWATLDAVRTHVSAEPHFLSHYTKALIGLRKLGLL